MKRVTGIGGIFFKCDDPTAIRAWYERHLGFQTDAYGTTFEWRKADDPALKGFTAWSPMKQTTNYFDPSPKQFMVNYRVENLAELVEALKSEGVTVLDEIETYDYGKFVHILDPEGNKIELWEPVDEVYDQILEAKTV
jgi:predicted enzyme related to lactoylglutathione lyase